MTRRFRVWLGVIAVAALGLRIAYVLTAGRRNPTGGDPLYYHVQANLLAHGHGFADSFTYIDLHRIVPSAMHPPLFSSVLAVGSLLGGTGFFAHKIVACIIGAATVVVVGLIGHRLGGPRAGLLAAALAALYPNLWVIDGILMPEGLFALTIAVVVLTSYWFADRPRRIAAVGLGVAIGAAALARGEAVLLLPLLALPLALRADRLRIPTRLGLLGITTLTAAVLLAPWTIRGVTTFKAPIVFSANSEEVIRNANCATTYHGRLLGYWDYGCYDKKPPGMDEAQLARFWRDRGLKYIRAHEGRVPVVVLAREGRVWDVWRPIQNTQLSTIEGRNQQINRAGLATYWLLVPFAIGGAVVLRRRGEGVWPLAVQALLVTAVAALAYGAVRFRVPAEVAIIVLGAVAIDALLPHTDSRVDNQHPVGSTT